VSKCDLKKAEAESAERRRRWATGDFDSLIGREFRRRALAGEPSALALEYEIFRAILAATKGGA
jgi:hypothetical protein